LKKNNILVINEHPNRESFCHALAAEAYKTEALQAGAELRVTYIEYVKKSDGRKREKWRSQLEKLGRSLR